MVPQKPKSKPTIEQALLEWRVIFAGVLETINDAENVDKGTVSETAVEVSAQVAAEIWKGVEHGNDA
jgi:hypothetical protein